jgi:hypothetical protein
MNVPARWATNKVRLGDTHIGQARLQRGIVAKRYLDCRVGSERRARDQTSDLHDPTP